MDLSTAAQTAQEQLKDRKIKPKALTYPQTSDPNPHKPDPDSAALQLTGPGWSASNIQVLDTDPQGSCVTALMCQSCLTGTKGTYTLLGRWKHLKHFYNMFRKSVYDYKYVFG